MSSELESLKQRITELETNNAKLEAEKAEIEIKNAELLKQVIKKDAKHDAENVKLGATIEKLKYENAELKDRITKVKQNQLQNDSAKGTQDKRNITPNNNLSNFNLGAVHHEKLLKEKEMDNFLLEEKKLSKAEQASLNQDQESDTGCSTSEKILEVSNPVTEIFWPK
ncbi:hypothetical protein RirG_049890 [Rhizophagus irregularis DAOM 197198w]|uniref:Uncharacterized protein n=1 Tax=Rhizophagus irregularis (strain DAOM 197198w) TaxID=1432141 RepID=A0A015LPA1_RHIIW|nr:hypothetical protein RirG_049890 [Rhizophagus irregularis DAOM 197198w]